MPAIGFVTKQDNGSFTGRLQTLTVNVPITITPTPKEPGSKQPDYRVTAGRVELGAAWVRLSQRTGEAYIAVTLAAPEFGRTKLYANLVAAADGEANEYALLWNPQEG